MRRYDCDIVVVGAGPGGCMAAKHAALGGLDVILIEKKAEIGAPLRCAEAVPKEWLEKTGIEPDPKWICAEVAGLIMISPSGHRFTLDQSDGGSVIGYVLERHLFDKALAEQAVAAGVRIMMRAACRGVIKEKGRITGIRADGFEGPMEIYAKCVVAADGFESQVPRWAGLDTNLTEDEIGTCIQYRMVNVDADQEFGELRIGSAAPGGYVWVFPKGKGRANVGIGMQASRCRHGGDPKHHLDMYIAGDPRLKGGSVIEIVAGGVSACPGAKETVTDGLIAVGDAARVIDPATGGGIAHACATGMYAGKVLVECAGSNDFSKAALMRYERMWRDDIGDRLYRSWLVKDTLYSLADDAMDDLVVSMGMLR
ncbi:MAG: NAD(P)/FAD-dependent oxidoreductase [Methanomassiliicoccaceae archaeon]|jgi:digeranylgeranylglycerophospholipid reductase|nr:NAD(P)/FAD-dependent oxidoreductase [Methanomassiliicoccaceae archaeon]